ncbi:MAG: FtsW/RodA/SpoVE family cell cycle protein [Actinomycetota bacterium]|nr:FtsW/RodA/SpoVE family cell cycle protein [Actinomycetota bacterium]
MSDAALPRRQTTAGPSLALTILAVVLAITAFVLVGLGRRGTAPSNLPLYAALFAIGYVTGHLVVRRLAPHADPAFFPSAALLTGIGFAMIYRLDPSRSTEQASWLIVALIVFAATLLAVRDHRRLDVFTYTIGFLAVGLLLLPIVPGLGKEINGSRVWVGFGPLTFQPAELGKVFMVVFLASYLNNKRELLQEARARLGPFHVPELKHLGPVLVAWGVSLVILFLEKDLGASLLYFGIFVVMLWTATARVAYLVVGALLFAIGAFMAYSTFGHVKERVVIWQHALEPKYLHASGYQLAQSEFAMATGGIGGSGLGQGQPNEIPFAETDFIFAAIGEELGMLGSTAVLLLFLVLVGKALKTAIDQQDGFGKLLAAGLAAILGIQTFIIVGGVTRVIPLTGVTLPFVSYGGSSLLANYILLALLIRISSGATAGTSPATPEAGDG